MNNETIENILKTHKLRKTNCRIDVMDVFLKSNKALTQGDLEQSLKKYDRVTLYRTLNSFLEAGILHKIPNDDGIACYGLCFETCTPENHHHNHAHFKCNDCGTIVCLDMPVTEAIDLPKGYKKENINVIIDGVCKNCS